MWILITLVLLTISYVSYRKIMNNPGEHRSGLTLVLPGIIAIFILISGITINHPQDVKLVNHVAEKIRCYYEKETPIRYSLVCNKGDEVFISKNTYKYFHDLWCKKGDEKATTTYVDGYKLIETEWNGEPGTSLCISRPEIYNNYIMNVYRLYDIHDIGVSTAIEKGLIIRSGVGVVNEDNVLEPRQNLILGLNVEDSIQRKLNYIASLDSMFRPVLLIFPGEERNKTKEQRSLWGGGKENELVFCIGLGEDNKILWSDSFSWDNFGEMEDYILSEVLSPGETLSIEKYINSLEKGYKNGYWKFNGMEKYGFIKYPLDQFLITNLMSIVVIINIILIVKLIIRKRK